MPNEQLQGHSLPHLTYWVKASYSKGGERPKWQETSARCWSQRRKPVVTGRAVDMAVEAAPAVSFTCFNWYCNMLTDWFQFSFLDLHRIESWPLDYRVMLGKAWLLKKTWTLPWPHYSEACPRYHISQAINISLSLIMQIELCWLRAFLFSCHYGTVQAFGERAKEGRAQQSWELFKLLLKYGGHAMSPKDKDREYRTQHLESGDLI